MKKNKHTCDLSSCFLCKNCLPEWSPAIAAHRKNFEFRKGETVFREGDPVTGIYFVNSGVVKVHKKWDQDKELIIRFASEGDVFGHRGLGKDSVYPISATALAPTVVCYIDLDFLNASLRTNYPFIHQLLQFFADELQESEKRMRNLAHMQVKGRVAQALLALRDKFGTTPDRAIGFTLSRQDLASFTGTTYETVFRIMNELVKDRIVAVTGKDIRILDPVRLGLLTKEEPYSSPSIPI
jgi:CRP/FNR family transcriptional regulator